MRPRSRSILFCLMLFAVALFLPSCSLFHGESSGKYTKRSTTNYDANGAIVSRVDETDINYAQSDIDSKRSIKMPIQLDATKPGYGHPLAINIESEISSDPAVRSNMAQFEAAQKISDATTDRFFNTLVKAGELYTGRTASGGSADIEDLKKLVKQLAESIAALKIPPPGPASQPAQPPE